MSDDRFVLPDELVRLNNEPTVPPVPSAVDARPLIAQAEHFLWAPHAVCCCCDRFTNAADLKTYSIRTVPTRFWDVLRLPAGYEPLPPRLRAYYDVTSLFVIDAASQRVSEEGKLVRTTRACRISYDVGLRRTRRVV